MSYIGDRNIFDLSPEDDDDVKVVLESQGDTKEEEPELDDESI